MRHGLVETRLDLAQNPLECLSIEMVFLQDSLGRKVGPQEDPEEQSSVLLRSESKPILLASNDNESLLQLADGLDDVCRREVGRL